MLRNYFSRLLKKQMIINNIYKNKEKLLTTYRTSLQIYMIFNHNYFYLINDIQLPLIEIPTCVFLRTCANHKCGVPSSTGPSASRANSGTKAGTAANQSATTTSTTTTAPKNNQTHHTISQDTPSAKAAGPHIAVLRETSREILTRR